MSHKQSQRSLQGQKAPVDPAAKKDHHTAPETIVSTHPVMSAETTSPLVVIVEVITAQTGQHLTNSTLQTANPSPKSLSSVLQGRYKTADQIIQNNSEQAGKAPILVAEDEAASMIKAASQGVALHLVEAQVEAGAILMVQAPSIRSAHHMLCSAFTTCLFADASIWWPEWSAVTGVCRQQTACRPAKRCFQSRCLPRMLSQLDGPSVVQISIKATFQRYGPLTSVSGEGVGQCSCRSGLQ